MENKLDAFMDAFTDYLRNGANFNCGAAIAVLSGYHDYKANATSYYDGKTAPPTGESHAGRRVCEYFSLGRVHWREFGEALFDKVMPDKTTSTCLWDGAISAGVAPAATSTGYFVFSVKGGEKTANVKFLPAIESQGFMWTLKKGRAADSDGATSDAQLLLFGEDATAGINAQAIKSALGPTKGGEDLLAADYPCMSGSTKKNVCLWRMQGRSKRCGLFFWGDESSYTPPAKPGKTATVFNACASAYFTNYVGHGEGIHVRNAATSDHPGNRMLDFGMPWTGGVSGSVIEFYAMIRHLLLNAASKTMKIKDTNTEFTLTNQIMAQLSLLNVATLVIAGHHSLGELLFGIASAEKTHGATHTIDAVSTHGSVDQVIKTTPHSSKNWYFYSSHMKEIIDTMNLGTKAAFDAAAPALDATKTDKTKYLARMTKYTTAISGFTNRISYR